MNRLSEAASGPEIVRHAVQQLVQKTHDMDVLREWYALVQQPTASLLDWMNLLYKLEAQQTRELANQLRTQVPFFQVDPQSLESPDIAAFSDWLRTGNHTALAAKLVFWVRGLRRSVVLTREYDPVLHILDEEFTEYTIPVVRTNTSTFWLGTEHPPGIFVQPVFRVINRVPAPSPSSSAGVEDWFRILPDGMTATSRRFYDRLVGLLGTPVHQNNWVIKSDALQGVVPHDTKEMDRVRTATYNWTRSHNTYESIADETLPGLLMKQTSNGRWFFRYNPSHE
jgi:hypothetical protein